jgi:A/G-specific adenine glycosylase
VITRIEGLEEEIDKQQVKRQIGRIVAELIPQGSSGDFNQALMEFGATVCVPKNPDCPYCPVKSNCSACLTERQNILPRKQKVRPPVELAYWVAVIRQDNRILMEYRENINLLGKMWGFPMTLQSSTISPEQLFREEYGLETENIRSLGTVKHVFTHQVWQMEVIEFSLIRNKDRRPELAWISNEQLHELPIPKAFQKVLRRIFEEENQ